MNRRVAQGAGLILLRLIVEAWSWRRPWPGRIRREGMALQAQQVHLGALQQARIRRAVRRMARGAAFDLHRFVLVDERPGLVRVALEAHQILRARRAQLPRQESTVRIVAIVALHESFVHAMVECPVELLLYLLMAAVAEQRRFFLHQELAFFGVVRIVAIDAAHSILQVRRAREVAVLLAILVAIQAARADLRR